MKYNLEITTSGDGKSRLELALINTIVEAVLTLTARVAGVEVKTALTNVEPEPPAQPK